MGSVQGGSVTMASIQPPRRSGFCVTSYVRQSRKRWEVPYCSAARYMPGTTPLPFAIRVSQLAQQKSDG